MLGSRTSMLCWGVDIGSGWVYPQTGSEPRAGVPWDIATMLCYKGCSCLRHVCLLPAKPSHWCTWDAMGSVTCLAHPSPAPGMWQPHKA